jgi:hypothetical protein
VDIKSSTAWPWAQIHGYMQGLHGSGHSLRSTAHVHEQRPARGRHTRVAQHLHSIVERVRDVVEIKLPFLEQALVNAPRDLRPVIVVHQPAGIPVSNSAL